jgi:hypothetical protein
LGILFSSILCTHPNQRNLRNLTCYMSRPNILPLLYHRTNIWSKVKITKNVNVQFSPTSSHFLPPTYKFSPHQSVHLYCQSMSYPSARRYISPHQ